MSDRHPDHAAEQAYLRRAPSALVTMADRSQRALEFADQRVRDSMRAARAARSSWTTRPRWSNRPTS